MTIDLRGSDASVRIDPDDGGRISSCAGRGIELLGGVGNGVIEHGSFVMAPWAGRVRFGRLAFGGREHVLPLRLPPHAAHGTVVDVAWSVDSATDTSVRLSCALADPWPIPGRVTQVIELTEGELSQQATVETNADPFPASIGWHPWFRRRLGVGAPMTVAFDADAMLVRDADGLPSGERTDIGDGPWDDCFVGIRWPVRLEWADALTLSIDADTEFGVVYNLRDAVWCIEPQTGPPEEVNANPRWVTSENPLVARMTWTWD